MHKIFRRRKKCSHMLKKGDNMNFEGSIKRAEEIIERLSSGDIPLDDAIKLYKEGAEELAACRRMIEDAEKTVMKVTEAEDLE